MITFSRLSHPLFDGQVIAELQPQGLAPLPKQLQEKGISAELDAKGKLKLKTRVPGASVDEAAAASRGVEGVEGGGAACREPIRQETEWGGGARKEPVRQETAVQREMEELRDMGLNVHMDPDTGLIDICHPDAPPPKFSY